jgi:hypothetical protein
MTTIDLLRDCARRGIRLSVQGTGLRVEPASKLDPELRRALRDHKPQLRALLTTSQVVKRPARAVSIEAVEDAGRTAYRLVDAVTGLPLLAGLFVNERWARAHCAEHDLHVLNQETVK